MLILIFVSLAVFGAYVLAWGIYRLQKKFPAIPVPSLLARIGAWTDSLISHTGEHKTATFGDLVLFVTLWVIAFTLWFTFSQVAGERYKEELGQANTKVLSLEGYLRDQQQSFQDLRKQMRFPVPQLPKADDQIIGDHADLQWESRQADSGQDYVIEVTMITGNSGKMPIGLPCMHPATESQAQRSRYPIAGNIASGTYIWRVGVGSLQRATAVGRSSQGDRSPQEDPCLSDDRIRTWSAYSKFTIYPTQKQRLMDTGEVLIGTNFNQSTPFSKLGSDGRPTGFEIDLIRAIIQECLVRRNGVDGETRIIYDRDGCRSKVSTDLPRIATGGSEGPRITPCVAGDCALHARIIELGIGDDWQAKMQGRDIDVYLGTLTRAKSREKGDIHFTSGYLAYDSELLTNNQEGASGLESLTKEKRTIGVIENSTNQWLAEELQKEFPNLSVRQFPSPAALEGAFEQKDIDLVVVDGILQWNMGRTGSIVKGLQRGAAWRRYMRLLGYSTEKFGIAVADDVKNEKGSENELREAINEALDDEPIRKVINYLYDYYELERYGTRRCNYRSDPCWEDRPVVLRKPN